MEELTLILALAASCVVHAWQGESVAELVTRLLHWFIIALLFET